MTTIVHISRDDAPELPEGTDLRTKEGRDAEVLAQIQQHQGFSTFWACDNIKRAHALKRLESAGRIQHVKGGTYPWCRYEVTEGEKT